MNTSLSNLMKVIWGSDNAECRFAIDVGAHHGNFTKFIAQTRYFNTIVAFEPNPEACKELLAAEIGTVDCGFEVVNSALSSESGICAFYCGDDSATSSLLKYQENSSGSRKIKQISVPVTTLDEYLDTHPFLGNLRLLKVDTQGNDLAVIKGGRNTILNHRPVIQTEFIYTSLYEGQCPPAELSDALLSMNYSMYSMNNLHVTPEGRLAFCDALFFPKELDVPLTEKYSCIDDQSSFQQQIQTLTNICAERLAVIDLLDAEVNRLKKPKSRTNQLINLLTRAKSWGR